MKEVVHMQKSKRPEQKNKEPLEFYESSGNIFKDLGRSDQEAASLLLRSELMLAVKETIQKHGWTQHEAAQKLGIYQPRISDLFQGCINKFSVETLMDWLDKLGKEVKVSVTNKRKVA
jgi:predicted XRE-type DNA-binding protein